MSYRYQSQWIHADSKFQPEEVSTPADAPQVVYVPMLVPAQAFYQYWGYTPTLYEYGVEGHGNPSPLTAASSSSSFVDDTPSTMEASPAAAELATAPAVSCRASSDNEDAFSDASTDVGDGDDIADDFEEDPKQVESVEAPRQPVLFAKLNRQQRVEQLKRVTDEYCALEFDSVEATSQESLVLRMLTILKSLSESTTFHGDHGRSEEKRLFLLGLGQNDEDAMKDVVHRAQVLCESRSFRSAFDVLKEVVPRLCGKSSPSPAQMSSEEIEAMKQRRLEKRQRQREERRVSRAADRAARASQHRAGVSSGAAVSCAASGAAASSGCQLPRGSANWSRKRH